MAARIAVIAVHGVADQSPGSTARAVVDLLVASAPAGTSYQAVNSESITLGVDPMPPARRGEREDDATPLGEDRSFTKAFRQSWRSDFQRKNWKSPDSQKASPEQAGEQSREQSREQAARSPEPDADRGIELSDYLLGKNLRNGAERESHETTRIGILRTEAGGQSQVDVFEMYWADLSRLSGAMPRIVTEIFTMIFRLSTLGRDTVDEAHEAIKAASKQPQRARPPLKAGWTWVAWLQIGLDWIFANGLALLFLQLGLLGAVLLGLGLLSMLEPGLLGLLGSAAALVLSLAGAIVVAYRFDKWQIVPLLLPLALLGAGLLALFVWPALGPWLALLLLLGAVTLANETGLRVAADRFPLARKIGRRMWLAVALLVVVSVWRQAAVAPGLDLGIWARSAIVGVEVVLFCIKWLWIAIAGLMPIWLFSGWWVAFKGDYEVKASIATGRLGLGLSLGAFLAIAMAIWALLSGVIEASVSGVDYIPCVFSGASAAAQIASAAAVEACPAWTVALAGDGVSAQDFLQLRYLASTSAFALVAAILLCLLAFLVLIFVPSILAEMRLLVRRARTAFRSSGPGSKHQAAGRPTVFWASDDTRGRRLGRWLTLGYRHLDVVANVVFAFGVLFALAVGLSFAGVQYFARWNETVLELSQGLLKPMVITAASISAVLVAFGGLLSKYLPGIRGPLDIALDVDNHFREFPRSSIPRARIFSRYVALLRHLQSRDYDQIVVVAHSQGSVISAELLRYLSSDGAHAPAPGCRPCIDEKALPPIRLLTVGCPLRQLYAARFPTLYRWVLARRGVVSGPLADDIGVECWVNAFCSGDYVGRWLWSDEPDAGQDPLAHPMVESVGRAFGRSDTYSGFNPMPPDPAAFAAVREIELCLGLGAHTHYFERDQTTVAWLIDGLIRR